MAAKSNKSTNSSNEDILAAASHTYASFTAGLKYGGIAAFLIAAFVIFLLASH